MKATTSHEEGDRTLKDTMKCTEKKNHLIKIILLKWRAMFFFSCWVLSYFQHRLSFIH